LWFVIDLHNRQRYFLASVTQDGQWKTPPKKAAFEPQPLPDRPRKALTVTAPEPNERAQTGLICNHYRPAPGCQQKPATRSRFTENFKEQRNEQRVYYP
jgi:hypothetical protein